ncbi:MAG: transcription antitermination factor NusB [Actinomycetota bacterium]|nr:transcription antitermination factor NusB [Actinomycetota bacterium]
MGARSKARKRALDVLYEAHQRGADPLETLRLRLAQSDPPVPEYAVALVEGVTAHLPRIDELLATYAEEWTLDRMPPVDLAALRIGAFELLWCPDVPDGVAVSEAVELVGSLSTDSSATFVNGLLARLLSLKPSLAV